MHLSIPAIAIQCLYTQGLTSTVDLKQHLKFKIGCLSLRKNLPLYLRRNKTYLQWKNLNSLNFKKLRMLTWCREAVPMDIEWSR